MEQKNVKPEQQLTDEIELLRSIVGDQGDDVAILVKEGVLKTYKPKKMKGQYYVSPTWFGKDGELKEEHKPETREVSFW